MRRIFLDTKIFSYKPIQDIIMLIRSFITDNSMTTWYVRS